MPPALKRLGCFFLLLVVFALITSGMDISWLVLIFGKKAAFRIYWTVWVLFVPVLAWEGAVEAVPLPKKAKVL